jgi:diguanylate cyclase (GGDEF)-like protein
MDLLLWRWSTAVQVTSAVMIAVFWIILARSDPRAELRWWVRAWVANLIALSITVLYWYLPPPPAVGPVVFATYMAAKTTFLLLLLQGAWALARPGAVLFPTRVFVIAAAFMAFLGAFVLTHLNLLGVGQHSVMAALLAAGAIVLARERAVTWLVAGLSIRAVLALIEAAAYTAQVTPLFSSDLASTAAGFLSAHSSFDTGAEWLIALGCVLAVAERTQHELRAQNARLLAAQEDLRRLADRDPLTGLANRRSLPAMLGMVQPTGATLLFFDIDKFKTINDLHGHHVGDECLKRFAAALRDCFRPGDTVVRFAGDEFLVIATGLDRSAVDERVAQLQRHMRKSLGEVPPFTFSVGIADLAIGGDPEQALQAADRRMYSIKSGQRRAVTA